MVSSTLQGKAGSPSAPEGNFVPNLICGLAESDALLFGSRFINHRQDMKKLL